VKTQDGWVQEEYEKTEFVAWAFIVYLILIIGFTVLGVVLLMKIRAANSQANNASVAAYGGDGDKEGLTAGHGDDN
jgi:glycopeptide antibiotics resistance protein